MIRFDTPLAFILLAFIPVIILFHSRRSKRAGVRFSSVKNAAGLGRSFRQQLLSLPLILRVLALIAFTIAIARPQAGKELVKDTSRGVAIEMVVDRSSSMSVVKDFGRETLSRLEVVKRAFSEFVSGAGGKLPGRPNDLIGLISFARYPDTLCPLTLSHGALQQFIDTVKVVQTKSEDGTSIGDALALAAARLKTAEEGLSRPTAENSHYEIKSKVIILLTDGEDTGVGKRPPLEAARLAKEWGIKVYTIGLGGDGWYVEQNTIFGIQRMRAPSQVNRGMLEQISEETDGIFRLAEDIDSLIDVYQEIDKLEKSEITSERYLDYKELFVYFALAGLLLLTLEFVLNATVFRRIP